jgi:hypothetical protein
LPITLLFLAANPTDTACLRVDQECRAIDEALLNARLRDAFTLEAGPCAWTISSRCSCAAVHFSGHGDPSGKILLEDGAGLSRLFAVLKGSIRCVILNACDSNKRL